MRMKRIATWLFIAMILSGIMLVFGLLADIKKAGGINHMTFGLGVTHDINVFKEIDLNKAKRIEVRTTYCDTFLKKNSSDKVSASLTGSVATIDPGAVPTLEVYQSGDVIYIADKRPESNNRFFKLWFFSSNNLKLEISLPESFTGEVIYNGTSGNFTAMDMALKSLDLDITSGDVKLTHLSLQNGVNISSTSGNITAIEVKATDMQIESNSGDVILEQLSLDESLDIDSKSGNKKMKDILCDQVTVDSTSGDTIAERVRVDEMTVDSRSGKVDLKELVGGAQIATTSGDINITVLQPSDDYQLSAKSGSIHLTLPSDTGFELDAEVKSGSIRCDFELSDQEKEENSLTGRYGNGDINIDVQTTSGDITIKKR